MKTAAIDLFGIDLPIFAFTHCRDVVAAVSKAGGMGVLGAGDRIRRQLEIDLDWIEAELGDRPYGVDLIVPAKYTGSDTLGRFKGHGNRPAPLSAAQGGASQPWQARPNRPNGTWRLGST